MESGGSGDEEQHVNELEMLHIDGMLHPDLQMMCITNMMKIKMYDLGTHQISIRYENATVFPI